MAKKSPADKIPRKKQFIKKPKFEGGTEALRSFISTNLRYPDEAIAKNIEGDVHVKYDVDENGKVLSARVVRGIGGGCDEEALRLVKMLKYIPARNRGVHVTTHMDIVIHFTLGNNNQDILPVQVAPVQQQFVYTYTSAPAVQEVQQPQQPQSVVYTYTLTVNK